MELKLEVEKKVDIKHRQEEQNANQCNPEFAIER